MTPHVIIESVIKLMRTFIRKDLYGSITINFGKNSVKYKVKLGNETADKVFEKL